MTTIGHIVALGGGHGLYQTLLAARRCQPTEITAVVTVADDGGSSGRIRRELDIIPPGDLRMALSALAGDDEDGALWAAALQHRFGGNGALAGHAVGNLMLAGLVDLMGDTQQALDAVGRLTGSIGRVLPMSSIPLEIEAEVSGLDDDPRPMHPVRGQVAVASTPGTVRRVRLIPEQPPIGEHVAEAILGADMVTIGPGSWFSSVIPHLLVPGIVQALQETSAHKVVVLNLSSEPGETQNFSAERHVHMLSQQCVELRVDTILVDESILGSARQRKHVERAALPLSADIIAADLRDDSAHSTGGGGGVHDPEKLARALMGLR